MKRGKNLCRGAIYCVSTILLVISCKGFSGVFTDNTPAAFTPGATVNLPKAGGGFTSATVISLNGNNTANGLDLNGDGIPDILFIPVSGGNGRVMGLDVNGDGVIDYYLVVNFDDTITIETAHTGGATVNLTTDANGNVTGFDTPSASGSPQNIFSLIQSDTTPPTIAASLAAGSYTGAQSVTLTCSDNVACNAIAYTTDGSTPSFGPPANGTLIAGSTATLTVSATTTLKYITRDAKDNLSAVGSETYTTCVSQDGSGGTLIFSPTTGSAGTLVTLTDSSGFDFSTLSSANISGTNAMIVATSSTQAQIMLMPGCSTGTIVATNAVTTIKSNVSFSNTTAGNIATQQGSKLVGTGNSGAAYQGGAVAISADGNTALIGGNIDYSGLGAVWVFTRSSSTWTQQGTKLVGTGAIGTTVYQGGSVALSANGNTALLGAQGDNSGAGAVWVFTRSGSTWTQQGTKLVGTGNTGLAGQGISVSLSADGNTALVGGYTDNTSQGAAWVFTRSGSTWTQQGSKLVGTGNAGAARQGISVSLSADGNTALIGGDHDNANIGAAWIFTRSGSTWTQQGAKLVGTGSIGTNVYQGYAVALSADGNTALLAGNGDNTNQGASWIFTRNGTTWAQQGSKIIGNPIGGNQGSSVALCANGNAALVGGFAASAAWLFTRSGGTWTQQGSKIVGTGGVAPTSLGTSAAFSADCSTAIIGGSNDNSNQGAAWVFVP